MAFKPLVLASLILCILETCLFSSPVKNLTVSFEEHESSNQFEKNRSHQEALSWIRNNKKEVWFDILELVHQRAELLQAEFNLDKGEMNVFINKTDDAWSGKWAIALTGNTNYFKTPYAIYVELCYDKVTLVTSAGLAFNIGNSPLSIIKEDSSGKEALSLKPIDISKAHKSQLVGIWTYKQNRDYHNLDIVDDKGLFEGRRYHDLLFLDIDDDLSYRFIMPFDGQSAQLSSGVIQAVSITSKNNHDNHFYLILRKETEGQWGMDKSFSPTNLKFITVVSDAEMRIRSGKKLLNFTRPVKSNFVDYRNITSMIDSRVGTIRWYADSEPKTLN